MSTNEKSLEPGSVPMVQIQEGLEGNRRIVSSGSALLQAADHKRILRKGSVEHTGLVPGCCLGYAGGI